MRKRILSLLVALSMVFSLMPLTAFAQESTEGTLSVIANGTCGDNLTWELTEDGILTISGTGTMKNYSFGATPWYNYRSQLKNVVIEDGVTSIGNYAFYNCYALECVTIPPSLTYSGTIAFNNCKALEAVYITDIGAWCSIFFDAGSANPLFYARNLYINGETAVSIMIPDGVTHIGEYAFVRCANMESITIPSSVTSIDRTAFWYCTGLNRVEVDSQNSVYHSAGDCIIESSTGTVVVGSNNSVIPEDGSVTGIGDYAFMSRPLLESVTIPDSVTEISFCAFQGCVGLKSVDFAEESKLESIGDEAFLGCSSLTDIILPASLSTIGLETFGSCTGLTSLAFEDATAWYKTDSYDVFLNRVKGVETDVTDPAANAIAFSDTARGCWWYKLSDDVLAEIIVSGSCGDELSWSFKRDGVLTVSGTGDMTNFTPESVPWYEYRDSITGVVLQEGVTSVGEFAFIYCKSLGSIQLPQSLTAIGIYAFSCCNNLSSVVLPEGLSTVGLAAFSYCSNLSSIVLPENLTAIGGNAFWDCGLTSITIPASVTAVEDFAFSDTLQEITFIGTTPPSFEPYAFGEITATVYYPAGAQWTEDVRQNYGGTLTWVSYGAVDVVAIDAAAFPDDIFRGYVSNNFDTDGNGGLSTSEIAAVNRVVVDDMGIADLTGIEYFTALERLFCWGNQLTELDVSSNTILEDLYCNDNQLTRLILGENAALLWLDCYNNQLTELDVSSNTALEELNCNENKLTSLDLSNNPALTNVQCFYNVYDIVVDADYTFDTSDLPDGFDMSKADMLGYEVSGSVVTAISAPGKIHYDYDCGQGYTFSFALNIANALREDLIASGICEDGLAWELNQEGVLTISGTGPMDVDYFVLASPWCWYKDQIKELVVENGVTTICGNAFEGCEAMEKVSIAPTVTSIGQSAFAWCASLSEIVIPSSIASIDDGAFYGCTGLKTVYNLSALDVVKGATTHGYVACYADNVYNDTPCNISGHTVESGYCTICGISPVLAEGTCGNNTTWKLNEAGILTISGTTPIYDAGSLTGAPWYDYRLQIKKVVIEEGVTHIGKYTFIDCTNLTEVVLPDSVISIRHAAFKKCKNLTRINIPQSLTTIGEEVFYSCSKLTDIILPDGVTSIGRSAFHGCSSLTEINIPAKVTSIESGTFRYCRALTKVNLQEGLSSIIYYAFENCTNLENITIPSSVTLINNDAFGGCSKLSNFYVAADNANYTSIDGVLFDKAVTKLIRCPATKSGGYAIPEGVTTIGSDAFDDCVGLETIIIPDSVVTIGSSAFSGCTNLKKIAIPEGVESIGPYTFHQCTSLTQVVVPSSVTSIGNYAFYECPISEITIPDSVTTIGNGAFQGCYNLTKINLPNSVTSIGSAAFNGCSFTEVVIPNSVTRIADSAFYFCTSLKTVYNLSALDIEKGATTHGYVAYYADNVYNDTPCNVHGHNIVDGVCMRCGYSTVPAISSSSLVLGGVLDLKITVEPGDGREYTLRATIDGEILQAIPGENDLYTIKLPAHRLKETVKLELVSGETVLDTKEWTMEAYSESLKEDNSGNTTMTKLLDTLTDYSAFAAYFAGSSDTAPNSEAVEKITQADMAPHKHTISTPNRTGLGAVTSLYLDDACDLQIKFNAENWAGHTLYINGQAVTPAQVGSKMVYEICELLPQDWSNVYNIKVVDAAGSTVFEVDYSVLSYGYICLGRQQESQTGLNGLMKSMYLYSKAASDYQG